MTRIQQDSPVQELSGLWNYRLDPDDLGLQEQWFSDKFENVRLKLPGTTNENGIGEPLDKETALTKESVRSLRQHFRYVGVVWYQREVRIPDSWRGKTVRLFMERVMFQSRVWIDGIELGMQDSLSVPHIYRLSPLLNPGETHLLTIRVDNRDCRHLGTYPSAYTDETQTIWNGIIGRLELQAEERIRVKDIQVYPDIEQREIKVKVEVENLDKKELDFRLRLAVESEAEDRTQPSDEHTFTIAASSLNIYELTYTMADDCALWDEFSPSLYTLSASLEAESEGAKYRDSKKVTFGMRSFRCNGNRFEINKRATFLRGTLDCCIYPLTGYPPMDAAPWERIFRIVKEYGLNHVRFHSWCPPEAAFQVADRLGVYLQVEGPVWMDTWNIPVGSHPDHYSYLPEEAKRIVDTYGNHPSFCLFSNGNELNGDFQLLHDIIDTLKKQDDRHVYTLTANWDRPLDAADDFFIAQTVDGLGVRGQYFASALTETTMLDYREAVAKRPVPVVSHEVGQYTVYPNMKEIDKYNGLLSPVNFEAIRSDLEAKHLLPDAHKFTRGSGKLAVQLYRDEIEATLRTPEMGGFQLLDLHDFPGQSTATVGILDAFWDSKGLIEPEEFRQFCSATVLLLRMPQRIYSTGDRFRSEAEIAHFGAEDLRDSLLEWEITSSTGERLDHGSIPCSPISTGSGIPLGVIESDCLRAVRKADKLAITLRLAGTGLSNKWDIWVYPEPSSVKDEPQLYGDILVSDSLDDPTEQHLQRGGSVLLQLNDSQLRSVVPGKFLPVFWSPVHFTSENPCGIFVRPEHPVFGHFPTDDYAGYQWKDLLERSVSIVLDEFPCTVEPLVQVIPNFFNNKKLANLFELNAGGGKLVICSIDLRSDLDKRPAARQLRQSILAYMAGDRFMPGQEIPIEQLKQLLHGDSDGEAEHQVLTGKELALGRSASASSEKGPDYAAGKGNDGIGHTQWCAADEKTGHWWQVDLGGIKSINGSKVKFAQEANYLYVIQLSDDGVDWRVAVNQTGQTSNAQSRIDKFTEKARYVRLVYNGLPKGVAAGHYTFEVFGA